MDKRYQVFISSTFVDLAVERREVMQALLEMEYMPAGMELFPSSDDDQWTLIQGIIENSDYYIVIVGGRYGSMTTEGISYTEKEYDYAVSLGIPVMGFVIEDPDNVPAGKTDKSDEAAEKLNAFRTKVETRMVKYWKNAEDLGSKVTRALVRTTNSHPRPGWVRGDQAMTSETRTEIAELEAKLAKLEMNEIRTSSTVQLNKSFAHGEEKVNISADYSEETPYGDGRLVESATLSLSWDEIVTVLGPLMIDEIGENKLRDKFDEYLFVQGKKSSRERQTDWSGPSAHITDESWGLILIQLRALKLITNGTKKRGIGDGKTYWKLTQAGDEYLVSLRAIPSNNYF